MIGGSVATMIWGLSAAAAVSAVVCIRGVYGQSLRRVFVFKPTTTILLLAVASTGGGMETRYGSLVLAAMVFALLGDILLMLPKDRFLHGLLSFLVAHLILVFAFAPDRAGLTWWLVGVVAMAALGVYAVLAPHLGRMMIPVTVYILVIGTMVWAGCERWLGTGTLSGFLAGVGAILFMVSDTVLGLNRFRAPFRPANALSLSTYWLSLWLIALSVRTVWM